AGGGAGGAAGSATPGAPAARAAGGRGAGRVLAYALGGRATPPPAPPPLGPVPPPPVASTASAAEVERGGLLYARFCLGCHGPFAIGRRPPPGPRSTPAPR